MDLRSHSIRLVFIYSSNVAARSYPGDRASPLYFMLPNTMPLNTSLLTRDYTFSFIVDDNADSNPDATWLDSVEVHEG
ncbi:MAG: hypothetical protein JRG73_19425 [Deltaproteobacteria bacterium]|nr:hypothetical protein [Deltaproteobacteria bacterium]